MQIKANIMDAYNRKGSLISVFLKGILYFLSMYKNPIKEYERFRKESSDADRIAGDWINVGNDISNAYEGYRSARA